MERESSEPSEARDGDPPPPRTGHEFAVEFTELYRRWRETVRRGALQVVSTEADAEDAAERVFYRLWNSRGRWRIEHPRRFFHEAGRNEALKIVTRRPDMVSLDEKVPTRALASRKPNPEQATARSEFWELVERQMTRLPPECGKVAHSVLVEDLTRSEAGRKLGKSRKAVEKQMARARRHFRASGLREMLSSFLDGGG